MVHLANMKVKYLVSCEHASNTIPTEYAYLFHENQAILNTHQGIDIGAYQLYLAWVKALQPDVNIHGQYSRLLIELNRSLNHPSLFSKYSSSLSEKDKKQLIEGYYLPYRDAIQQKVKQWIEDDFLVIHFSIHSFTPQLGHEVRDFDMGLLFDPSRVIENLICEKIKSQYSTQLPQLIVKFNAPYLGIDDGVTTWLRSLFLNNYVGIEVEYNQKKIQQNQWPNSYIQTAELALLAIQQLM